MMKGTTQYQAADSCWQFNAEQYVKQQSAMIEEEIREQLFKNAQMHMQTEITEGEAKRLNDVEEVLETIIDPIVEELKRSIGHAFKNSMMIAAGSYITKLERLEKPDKPKRKRKKRGLKHSTPKKATRPIAANRFISWPTQQNLSIANDSQSVPISSIIERAALETGIKDNLNDSYIESVV